MTTDQAIVLFCFGAYLIVQGWVFLFAVTRVDQPATASYWAACIITIGTFAAGVLLVIHAGTTYIHLMQGAS